MHLTGDGEILKSQNKRYKETIIFVPFFFGKKSQLRRHAEFLNELGFDCVIFNLSDNLPFVMSKVLKNIKNGWGLKHLWTQEISSVFDAIQGDKIVYSFSNPTSSAIEAIAKRSAKDIKALICDGGPFYDLLKCNWNYFTYEYPVKNIFRKIGANTFARMIWTIGHEKELYNDLHSFPKNFPVLSIRGWQDPLVPPTCIEKAFQPHDQLDLEVLNLPQGKHLDGLKGFPEIYKPRVEEFLKSVSTH